MSSQAIAFYWDPAVSQDGCIIRDKEEIVSEGSEIRKNIALIQPFFCRTNIFSSLKSLVHELFITATPDAHFNDPIAIFLSPDDREDERTSISSSDSVISLIRLICSRAIHANSSIVVLCDQREKWTAFCDNGAAYTSYRSLDIRDINYVLSNLLHIEATLGSRTLETKSLLGMDINSTKKDLISRFVSELALNRESVQLITPKIEVLKSKESFQKVDSIIGLWDFRAHDLNYDELLLAAFLIFKHAFSMPSVKDFILSDSELFAFLCVVRDSYHSSNPYHNFRHAIDVLQATFFFLLVIGSLPAHTGPELDVPSKQSIKMLDPVESLTLLIAAIGHDVGHPGVTNAFLISCEAPIARLYNDKSVLESYHSAAFSQILKVYWPATQRKSTRKLIIESVLATDMALHFEYMKRTKVVSGGLINDTPTDQYSMLLCCLLIKCADISNVARSMEISSEWGIVLGREFADVSALEVELGMKDASILMSSASDSDQFAKGQIFFIDTYAKPLFSSVSELLPPLGFASEILSQNAAHWKHILSTNHGG